MSRLDTAEARAKRERRRMLAARRASERRAHAARVLLSSLVADWHAPIDVRVTDRQLAGAGVTLEIFCDVIAEVTGADATCTRLSLAAAMRPGVTEHDLGWRVRTGVRLAWA